ncbi:MAG: hypothetical protein WAL95_22110 [Candidatus Acidiferrales bacterium]
MGKRSSARKSGITVHAALFYLAALAGLAIFAFSPVANPSERIHLIPKFVTGQTFRYQIETRTTTTSNTTTPVVNPEAPSQLKQVSDLQLRLDVLDAQSDSTGALGTVRLRVTYEKAGATTESDAYDPAADALEDQYNRLQGRSMEFTIEPTGEVSKITGLDDVYSNPSATATVRSWLNALSASAKLPHEGIAIGQKWNNERPLENTPLAGLVSRTESTYLRDEPCQAQGKPTPSGAPAAQDNLSCAIVLTRFEILRKGSTSPDATPDDYRHNGLRTSGTWTGNGESLDAISLQNGMITRSTQTSKQDMDFEIVSALSGSKMHYVGHVESQSEVTLMPPSSSDAAPATPGPQSRP